MRLKQDLTALEEFEVAFDKHLFASGIKVRSEKRGAMATRWYRSFLQGKEILMNDVHTWVEPVRDLEGT